METSRKMKQAVENIYISPLEMCNLKCKMCYTKKTKSILTSVQILDFVERYTRVVDLKSITFCGGEVFTLPTFTKVVNDLTSKNIFVQIITNGTVNKLDEINCPNSVNLIVSIDGLPEYHDRNRGEGSWKISTDFMKKAKIMGFFTEIFSIVTKENFDQIPEFERLVGNTPITYHPRKPFKYLNEHPVSNIIGETKGFSFLTNYQLKKLWESKNVFPPKRFGCYQISLMSNGFVYGCCEGYTVLGHITSDPKIIIANLKKRVRNGCAEPSFMCGLCR